MKLITLNVNGIRAVSRGRFHDWFSEQNADVICVQEIKAYPTQLEGAVLHPSNYHSYWHSAAKAGYSGVAIYSKKEPQRIQLGIGIPEVDLEGRVILAEYSDFTLINTYFPNSQRDHARLPYKLSFCKNIFEFCEANEKNAGFLPEERAWMDHFLTNGYIDTFRKFNSDPGHYTWWSYRPGVREKNIGWRLDYFCTNKEFQDRLESVAHQPEAQGSDHCPVVLQLKP
jgi:exodeoxyribonuclease-3